MGTSPCNSFSSREQILRLVLFREFWNGMPPSDPGRGDRPTAAAVTTAAVAAADTAVSGARTQEAGDTDDPMKVQQELASRVTTWFPRWMCECTGVWGYMWG